MYYAMENRISVCVLYSSSLKTTLQTRRKISCIFIETVLYLTLSLEDGFNNIVSPLILHSICILTEQCRIILGFFYSDKGPKVSFFEFRVQKGNLLFEPQRFSSTIYCSVTFLPK